MRSTFSMQTYIIKFRACEVVQLYRRLLKDSSILFKGIACTTVQVYLIAGNRLEYSKCEAVLVESIPITGSLGRNGPPWSKTTYIYILRHRSRPQLVQGHEPAAQPRAFAFQNGFQYAPWKLATLRPSASRSTASIACAMRPVAGKDQ